jgi:hypothetical protein
MREPSPDDLSVLIPESRTAELSSGGALVFPELTVRELAPMMRAMGEAVEALASGDVAAALGAHGEAITAGLALACGATLTEIAALPDDDYGRCLGAMMGANEAIFAAPDAEAPGDPGEPVEAPLGWSDVLQSLVSAGHPPYMVEDYTLRQVQWWGASVSRRRTQYAAMILAAAIGSGPGQT